MLLVPQTAAAAYVILLGFGLLFSSFFSVFLVLMKDVVCRDGWRA